MSWFEDIDPPEIACASYQFLKHTGSFFSVLLVAVINQSQTTKCLQKNKSGKEGEKWMWGSNYGHNSG